MPVTEAKENVFLDVRGVKKRYGVRGGLFRQQKRDVLRSVNFSVRTGECAGLIGLSGAGKSTLTRILLGLEQPDEGSVLVEGRPLRDWRRENPGAMSVVFQDYTTSVDPSWTVRKILLEPLDVLGRRGQSPEELLSMVGLSPDLQRRYPHELSGGMLQRVCIARALSTRPRFIVFDEAVSSLDASVQSEILALLAGLRSAETTWLFISHDLQAVAVLCPRILFLDRGMIAEDVSVKELDRIRTPQIRALMEAALPFETDAEIPENLCQKRL